MNQSTVEWIEETIGKNNMGNFLKNVLEQAKEMEKNIAEEYAEFCIRCDRAGLPIVKFDDWRKELTFKSE